VDVALVTLSATGGELADIGQQLHLPFAPEHREINSAFPRGVPGEIVPGIGVPHDPGARVGSEYPLEPAVSHGRSVGNGDHPSMDGISDPHSTAVMQ
jgi:hypothetical protein